MLGGLGNQMFQYAAAKSLAVRHGVPVVFDLTGYRSDRLRNFLLDQLQVPEAASKANMVEVSPASARRVAFLRWRNRFERVARRLGLPPLPRLKASYAQPGYCFDPGFYDQGPTVALLGFFQSERYFSGITDMIRAHFQPREALSDDAQVIADRIANSAMAVSVHVRRGDYVNSETTARFHGALGTAYYEQALRVLQPMLDRPATFFVFSDDPEEAKQALRFVPQASLVHVRGDPQRPWEDLALMARCHHHVIANSSFSWWGAWLNPSVEKIVVAPRRWFSVESLRQYNTCDLYPEGWILI